MEEEEFDLTLFTLPLVLTHKLCYNAGSKIIGFPSEEYNALILSNTFS